MIGGYVVWVPGLRGPAIQKWPEICMRACGKPAEHLVAHPATSEIYALPLDSLATLYPPPAINEDR